MFLWAHWAKEFEMGYCVDMSVDEVKFPVSKLDDFWKIIQKLAKKGGVYSWVGKNFDKTKDPTDVFHEWRYDAHLSRDGKFIEVSSFEGEKLGDDEEFWRALAPVMCDGGVITCHGEDDENWKWKFTNGQMLQVEARLVWDDEGKHRIKGATNV
jgi:hypothetical protein